MKKSNGFDIPILFIVFNRLENTKRVFKEIIKQKPKKLYIASDGARKNVDNEFKVVLEIRNFLVQNIDWDCQVNTIFRDKNLGCGNNINQSLNWFFKHEEMGIIIEDDCLPTPDFFLFTKELLVKYKEDNRIGMICGSNHFTDYYQSKNSYLFTRYKSCWGWATWKSSWENMDFEMSWLNSDYCDSLISNMGYGAISKIHWKNAIKKILNKEVDAWDWQWYFSLAKENQLAIMPRTNLVSNIGFDKNSTNSGIVNKKSYWKTKTLNFPLKHPEYFGPDLKFEKTFENKKLKPQIFKDLIPTKCKKIIAKCLNI